MQELASLATLKSLGVKVNYLSCEVNETWQKQQYEPISVKFAGSVSPDEIDAESDRDIDWDTVATLLLAYCHQRIWQHVIPILERTGRLEPLVTEKLAGVPIDSRPERWQETHGIDSEFHYALAADVEQKRRESAARKSVSVQAMM